MEFGINTFITETGKNGGGESTYVEETIKVTIALEEYRALVQENQRLLNDNERLMSELDRKNAEIAGLQCRNSDVVG